jgi:phage tail sheath gpL-like
MTTFNFLNVASKVPQIGVELAPATTAPGTAPVLARLGLVVLPKTAEGTATANVPVTIGSAQAARNKLGAGSQACQAAIAFLAGCNNMVPLKAIPVDDNPEGTPAEWTLTFSGDSTAAGTVYLKVGGHSCYVAIPAGTSDSGKATLVKDAVNADADLAVTAEDDGADCILTAKNAGIAGNMLRVIVNHEEDQELPAGCTLSISVTEAGTGDPDYDDALALLDGSEWYTDVVGTRDGTDFVDEARAKLATLLQPPFEKGGTLFLGRNDKDAIGDFIDGNDTDNDKHVAEVVVLSSPSSPWEIAGAAAGIHARYAQAENGLYLYRDLTLPGIVAPARADRVTTIDDHDLLLAAGWSSTYVDRSGAVKILRLCTTYRTDGEGAADDTYFDTGMLDRDIWLQYSYHRFFYDRLGRDYILAEDGTAVGPGIKVLTPKTWKGMLFEWGKLRETEGFIQDLDGLMETAIGVRSLADLTRFEAEIFPVGTSPYAQLFTKINPVRG